MKHVATHTVTAYARSLDLTLREAFTKAWCGYTGHKKPTTEEAKRIGDDLAVYHGQGVLPYYLHQWLAHPSTSSG